MTAGFPPAEEWRPVACKPGHDCGVARNTGNGLALVFDWPSPRGNFRWSFMGFRSGRRVTRAGACKSIEIGKLRADAAALECDP